MTASARGHGGTRRTAFRLAFVAFLVFAITGGGRVVGSDEVAMLDLARAMLRGGIAVPEGATLAGPDGRHYTKNAAGQAVLTLPLVALAEAGAAVAGLSPSKRRLALRFAASFFNAAVTAVLLAVFYSTIRALGAGPGAGLAAALLLGFTTPLWPYAKSFMAEPLQALGLLLALGGSARAAGGDSAAPAPGERAAGLGVLLAVSAKLTMLPLALASLTPLLAAPPRRWKWPLAGLLLALAGHAFYNVARFGTPLESGYGVQASASAFTTPILVGLYGLLLSSGKGVMWFAPALWLAGAGWRGLAGLRGAGTRGVAPAAGQAGGWLARVRAAHPARRAAWGAALAWIAGLLLYARFQHWAGDGSYGPRYLIPLLPLGFIVVAFGLERLTRARRAFVWLLVLAGVFVQVGGVGVYFGAQMREAGDYPYTLPLEHPRFMSDSHFNPAFSPVAGHWRMLLRNAGEHARGDAPRLDLEGGEGSRLGVGEADQARLLRALDFWWLYLGYAGFPGAPVALAVVALLAMTGWATFGLRAAVRAEERAP